MPKLPSRVPPSSTSREAVRLKSVSEPAARAVSPRPSPASTFVAGTRAAAPQATAPLAAVFRHAGLSAQVLDVEGLRRLCTAETLATVKPLKDGRGEELARAIFQDFSPKAGELGLVLVGGHHFSAIANSAVQKGLTPFTTGGLSPESLQRHVDTTKPGFQEILGTTLSTAQHYSSATQPALSDLAIPPPQPFVMVSDLHGAEYELALPSAADLVKGGVRSIKVFLENESEGPVALGDLARSFSGKNQLAAVLETYRAAGIEVKAVGLETWSAYRTRPDALGVLRTPEELASSQPLPPPVSNSPMFLQLAREQRIIATAAMPFGDALPWLENQLANLQFHSEKDGIDFTAEAERYRQAIKEVEAERAR